jgi:hypothetical protein
MTQAIESKARQIPSPPLFRFLRPNWSAQFGFTIEFRTCLIGLIALRVSRKAYVRPEDPGFSTFALYRSKRAAMAWSKPNP